MAKKQLFQGASKNAPKAKYVPTVTPTFIEAVSDHLALLAYEYGVVLQVQEIGPFLLGVKILKEGLKEVPEFLEQQLVLADELDVLHGARGELAKAGGAELEAHFKLEDETFAKLKALQPEEGIIGQVLNLGTADGHAHYLVVRMVGRRVQVAWLPVGDAWTYAGVDEYSTISLALAKQVVHRQRNPLFGCKTPQS